MSIDSLVHSLRTLAHADATIADIIFRARVSQIAIRAAAFCVAIFGLIMLGIAAYSWLTTLWGPVLAALVTALGSFAVAILIAAFASLRKPGKELALAREMHVVALDSLVAEIKRSGSGFLPLAGLLGGRLDTSLLALIGPLAALLLRFLRRNPDQPASG